MARFDQRDSGYWQARIRRKGWPAESKTFRTKAEAEAWARGIESSMDRGSFVSSATAERTLLDDVIKAFRTNFAPHHYRGSAWANKLDRLSNRLGAYSLASITADRVAWYRDERLKDPDPRYKDPKTAPRLSAATVKTEIDMLSKVLDVAAKEMRIALPAGNPVSMIRKPVSAPPRERRLTSGEAANLFNACQQSRNRWLLPAVQLSIETGMRQGELLGLKWADIDLTKRVAYLAQTKNGTARAVPLSSKAAELMQGLARDIRGNLIPVEKQTLHSAFKAACGRAKLHDFRWHDLRHEALSRLAERGDLSVLELSAISGHKTLRLVQMYVQLHAAQLAQKLG
jgi:integrase